MRASLCLPGPFFVFGTILTSRWTRWTDEKRWNPCVWWSEWPWNPSWRVASAKRRKKRDGSTTRSRGSSAAIRGTLAGNSNCCSWVSITVFSVQTRWGGVGLGGERAQTIHAYKQNPQYVIPVGTGMCFWGVACAGGEVMKRFWVACRDCLAGVVPMLPPINTVSPAAGARMNPVQAEGHTTLRFHPRLN